LKSGGINPKRGLRFFPGWRGEKKRRMTIVDSPLEPHRPAGDKGAFGRRKARKRKENSLKRALQSDCIINGTLLGGESDVKGGAFRTSANHPNSQGGGHWGLKSSLGPWKGRSAILLRDRLKEGGRDPQQKGKGRREDRISAYKLPVSLGPRKGQKMELSCHGKPQKGGGWIIAFQAGRRIAVSPCTAVELLRKRNGGRKKTHPCALVSVRRRGGRGL